MKMRTVLYADEGMVLTDGKVYGRQILLGDGAETAAFREITAMEYEAVLAEEAHDGLV